MPDRAAVTRLPAFLTAVGLTTVGLATALLAGCSSPSKPSTPPSSSPRQEREIDAGLRASEDSVARPSATAPVTRDTRPAALIAGVPVSDAEIRAYANEIAGSVALEEIALDRIVRQRFQGMGLTLVPTDIEQERRFVVDSMAREAETSTDSAAEMLERIRRQRGLGPKRFSALLERNAMMRKLVAPTITVTEDQVEQAVSVRYGERRIARIIVRNTQQEASASLLKLQGLTGAALTAAFTDEASRNSVDASAARGGLLEPISVVDPAYPSIIRSSLGSLNAGQLSTLLALDKGFAIVLLESISPASTPPAGARDQAREQVTRRAQRVAMDRLARDILLSAGVTPYEDSLRWSWDSRPNR